ncbi:MAG: hypothetical protein AAF357_08775, partial [Verrucomicrobiota bacterium]
LNFIKASELKRHAIDCGYEIYFDRKIFSRMLSRLTSDPSFSNRHGSLATLGRIGLRCGVGNLTEYFPLFLLTYMKVTITLS